MIELASLAWGALTSGRYSAIAALLANKLINPMP